MRGIKGTPAHLEITKDETVISQLKATADTTRIDLQTIIMPIKEWRRYLTNAIHLLDGDAAF
jgi:hypothetical protein